MFGDYVFSNAHNYNLTPEFSTSFCPSYFVAQEARVAPKVSTTRHVFHIDGIASSSSPITWAKGAQIVITQSFRPLNMKEKRHLIDERGGDYYTINC
jgi:hypothetical protein